MVYYLVLSQLGDDVHAHGLIEATETTQALAIRAPVEADDGLRGDDSRVEQLHGADNADRNVLLRFSRFFPRAARADEVDASATEK